MEKRFIPVLSPNNLTLIYLFSKTLAALITEILNFSLLGFFKISLIKFTNINSGGIPFISNFTKASLNFLTVAADCSLNISLAIPFIDISYSGVYISFL